MLSTVLGSAGDAEHLLAIETSGSAKIPTPETLAQGEHFITMRGSNIFKLAVRAMTQAAIDALAKAGLETSDVDVVLAHQANVHILRSTQEALGLPWEKFVINLDRYGNTGAASVPIVLSEHASSGAARPGDDLLLASFGGGLTWAAAVVRWGNVEAIVGRREARSLPARRLGAGAPFGRAAGVPVR